MKARNGFVSNSSSSSFIIGYKGNLSQDKLKRAIIDALKVPKDSPLFFLAEEITQVFMTAEEYDRDDYEMDEAEELLKKGMTVLVGSASDEGTEPTEALLCDIDLNYESPELVIIKEGGY